METNAVVIIVQINQKKIFILDHLNLKSQNIVDGNYTNSKLYLLNAYQIVNELLKPAITTNMLHFIILHFYTLICTKEKMRDYFSNDVNLLERFQITFTNETQHFKTTRKITSGEISFQQFKSKLISSFQKSYRSGTFLSVDEMLFPSRLKCKNLIYLPSKPCRYGLKHFALCDRNGYVLDYYLYEGRETKRETKPGNIVESFTNHYDCKDKIIVADSYFSSLETCENLNKKGVHFLFCMQKSKCPAYEQLMQRTTKNCWSTTSYKKMFNITLW